MEIQFVFFLISKLDSTNTLLFPWLLQEITRKNREERVDIPIHILISENAIYSLIDPPKYLIECWIAKSCHLYINRSHWTALLSEYGNKISHSMPSKSHFMDNHDFNYCYCQLVRNPTACVFKI